MNKINLGLIKVDNLNQEQVIEEIKNKLLKSTSPNILVTPNAGHLKQLENNQDLSTIYQEAQICLADGWPIALAASIAGKIKISRVTGSDLVPLILKELTKDIRVGIIGGNNQTKIRSVLESKYPNLNLQVVDVSQWSDSIYDIRRLRELVQYNALSIVFLCLGHPKQEILAQELRNYDWVGSRPDWIMCLGASIDFLIGEQKRAPKLLTKLGLEWLHRLTRDPSKFFFRYLEAIWPSIFLILNSIRMRKFN